MITAECYFLDVGQGAAQVVDLGDGSAIVIDCGRSYPVLGDLLHRRLDIQRIAALVMTHNHEDHVGGVPGLVAQFRKSIDAIYFLQDRPAGELRKIRFFDLLRAEYRRGNIPAPCTLVRNDRSRWLHGDNDQPAEAIRLELLFPDVIQNIQAQAAGNPNSSSAVLLLQCGGKRVLFPGDLGINGWRSIGEQRSEPIQCDVLAVPHHGGQIVRHANEGESCDDLHEAVRPKYDWLYREVVSTRFAVISVGTSNPFSDKHPIPPHVGALRDAGVRIACTQLTDRCCGDVESLRPGVLTPRKWPGRSEPRAVTTPSGESRDVACAGTVLVQIGPDELRFESWEQHQAAIDRKLAAPMGCPLCR